VQTFVCMSVCIGSGCFYVFMSRDTFHKEFVPN
jgi:hypothetical protein